MLYAILVIVIIVLLIIIFSKRKRPNSKTNGRGASLQSILKESYPNRTYKEVFEIVFRNAKDLLESMPRYKGNDTEILAFLSRIGTVTVLWVGGEIQKYKRETNEFVDSVLSEENKNQFLKRESFYWGISNGKKAKGLWALSDIPPSIMSVPMLRCAVAFGDCITNPEMIDDYENAPLLIDGVGEVAAFQNMFMGDFFRLVHTYCVMLAGREFDPPIVEEYEGEY